MSGSKDWQSYQKASMDNYQEGQSQSMDCYQQYGSKYSGGGGGYSPPSGFGGRRKRSLDGTLLGAVVEKIFRLIN